MNQLLAALLLGGCGAQLALQPLSHGTPVSATQYDLRIDGKPGRVLLEGGRIKNDRAELRVRVDDHSDRGLELALAGDRFAVAPGESRQIELSVELGEGARGDQVSVPWTLHIEGAEPVTRATTFTVVRNRNPVTAGAGSALNAGPPPVLF
jgi:hypothetical protein